MDLSTNFLNCNGRAMQIIAHFCWFSSLAQVLMIKSSIELVESFHGCNVTLRDYRDDIVDFHIRCDPTVWHTVKNILAVDPGFILSWSWSFLKSSDYLLPYLNFSLPVARSIGFLPLSCSLSISIMRWINHCTLLCWSPFRLALSFLEFYANWSWTNFLFGV